MSHAALQTKAFHRLLRAAQLGVLPHSIILHGRDAHGLESAALALAEELLRKDGYRPRISEHADLFWLRPSGKLRMIRIGDSASDANTVRNLIQNINLAPTVGDRKVAIIPDADCFNASAANAFLKTLEEPPHDTTIFLLSTKPHSILPTIRSRCQHFFIATPGQQADEPIREWCAAYAAWLTSLEKGLTGRAAAADPLIQAYGLVARATEIISRLASEKFKKLDLPESLSEDETEAIERGFEITFRTSFLSEIAKTTRDHAARRLSEGAIDARRKLVETMARLNDVSRLLRYNLADGTALEYYLLSLLRIWVARPAPRTS
jgi:DNA polymerase-3 subunit delta'